MVPAFVKQLGSTGDKSSSSTTLNHTFTGTTAAGNLIVACILFDNASVASKPVVSSISRQSGETATWQFLGAARSTSTSAGSFASGELWCIKTTVPWAAAVYTITLDTAVTMKAVFFIEFSGVLATLRSTVGTAYSTTTTQAQATSTGTTPLTNDLAIGFEFASNLANFANADADNTGGLWSTVSGAQFGTTGGNAATNNYGAYQYKILNSGVHQTFGYTGTTTAGNGSIIAILQADSTSPPNQGSTSISYTEQVISVGKETPKGSGSISWTNSVISVGKETPKGSGSISWTNSVIAFGTKPADPVSVPKTRRYNLTFNRVYSVPDGSGSAIISWLEALSASGKLIAKGSGTISWTEQIAASGKEAPKSTGVIGWFAQPTASGKKIQQGTSVVSWVEAITVSGKKIQNGSAVISWTEAVIAVGKRTPKSSVTVSWLEAITVSGKSTPKSSGVISWSEVISSAGKRIPSSSSVINWLNDVTATGKETPKASATVSWDERVTASGAMPIVGINKGSGLVSWNENASASGKTTPKSSGVISWAEAVIANGQKIQNGVAVLAWTEQLTASGKKIQKSSVVISWVEALTATGYAPQVGINAGSGSISWRENAAAYGTSSGRIIVPNVTMVCLGDDYCEAVYFSDVKTWAETEEEEQLV